MVSEDELKFFISGELSKDADCGNARAWTVTKLNEPDKDGCNWSRKVAFMGNPCPLAAERIIEEMRKKYNVL
jgi:hypothetical protein